MACDCVTAEDPPPLLLDDDPAPPPKKPPLKNALVLGADATLLRKRAAPPPLEPVEAGLLTCLDEVPVAVDAAGLPPLRGVPRCDLDSERYLSGFPFGEAGFELPAEAASAGLTVEPGAYDCAPVLPLVRLLYAGEWSGKTPACCRGGECK